MGRPDIVVLALLCILSTSLAHRRDSAAPSCAPIATENGPGTTLGLEATYKGLCYKSVKSTLCDASWTSFEQIVLSKGPSDFNWRDFEVQKTFTSSSPFSLPCYELLLTFLGFSLWFLICRAFLEC